MRKLVSAMLALMLCASLLSSCNHALPETGDSQSTNDTSDTNTACKHNWERSENFNDYTAVDKCSICGVTRMYTDPDNIPDSY